ncbi:MAG: hypothetical protein ICV79_12125, partial [Flavisolibacter sp.]|nr:hypothetical protein [Flavisolibacter sp.]
FRRAFSHYTNLNISGGGDRSDYSFTASLFNQQNVLNNEFRRINLSSNLGFDLFKGLTFRSVSQIIIGKEDLISGTYNVSRIVNIDPLFQASNNNRFLLINSYPWVDFTFRNASGYLTLKPKAQENQLNPLSEQEWHERFSKTNRFLQNFNLNYKFPKFVELDYKYGIELWNTDYNDFYKNPTGVPQASAAFWGSSPTGSIRADYVKTVFQNSLATLFFRTDFEQDFGLNVPIKTGTQVSYDYRDYDYRSYFSKGSGLPSYPPLTIQSSNTKTSGDWYESFRTHGVLFNQAIDFGNYGGVTGGFRSDYSSEFGEAKHPFTFYRGTAYFRPSEFLKPSFLTDWKLRAAYGEAGVQPHEFNGDYYLRQQTLEVNPLGGGVSLSFPTTAKNNALRVQKTRELEIGTDVGLHSNSQAWLNKVVLSGSWWTRRSDDIIQAAPIPISTGAAEIVDNLLKLKSRGLDLSLDAGVFTAKNFDWQLGVRFGTSRSKVVDISNGQTFTSGVYALKPGDNIGVFYAVTPLSSLTQTRPDKTPYIDPADVSKYEVVNGMVVDKETKRVQLTDANDLSVVGKAYPDFTMSLINSLSIYKHLNLSFQFDWYQGNDIYNMSRQWLYRDKLHKDFDVPVTIDGKTGAYVNFYNSLYNSVQRTSWFVENGSFVRLRDLSLSYNLTNLINRNWLKNISITLAGRNLLTFTKYSGLDPEATTAQDSQGNVTSGVGAIKGVDYFGIPNLKSFIVGLSVEF